MRAPRLTVWRIGLALSIVAVSGGCDSRLAAHVLANQLVNGKGAPLRLHGVNRSGAEYACVDRLGIIPGPIDHKEIAAMAAWRINAVRIPLNEDCWLGINGVPARLAGSAYRQAIRAYVARLNKAGLYVVLDLHWSAPGSTLATGQQPMADLDHGPAFWSSVARTFRSDPGILFELYNEPFDVTWRCWRDGCVLPSGWRTAGMQTLVDAVRSQGAKQPIVATGLEWGGDLSAWLRYRPRDPLDQLVAGMHAYDFRPCVTPDCWSGEARPVAREVPVIATEFGQKACTSTFIERFMRWADRAGVSYLAWAWDPSGCAAPSLIRTWDGQPTLSGAVLRTHLLTGG